MQKLGEILTAAGIVTLPLLVFSVVAISLIMERSVFWYQVMRRQDQILKTPLELYRDEPELAIEKLQRHVNLPISRIFLEAQ